jgi:hypothetical protein
MAEGNWTQTFPSLIEHTKARGADINTRISGIGSNYNMLPAPHDDGKKGFFGPCYVGSPTELGQATSAVDIRNGAITHGVDSGVADAYVVTLGIASLAYVAGMKVNFVATTTNTGTSTIDIDGLGVIALKASATMELPADYIYVDDIVEVIYTGTFFQITSITSHVASAAVSAAAAAVSETAALASETAALASETAALASETAASLSETSADTDATTASTQAGIATSAATAAQLDAWTAEAEKITAASYADEAEDVFVKIYTSDGDGTFTATDTTEYSALHWAAKAEEVGGDVPSGGTTGQVLAKASDTSQDTEWADGGGGMAWEASASGDVTAVAGVGYLTYTDTAARNVNLPAGVVGESVGINDVSQNGTNSITIITSGSEKFMGLVENFILDIDGSSIVATYADATNGWVITDGSW